jgi:hypothetical protein
MTLLATIRIYRQAQGGARAEGDGRPILSRGCTAMMTASVAMSAKRLMGLAKPVRIFLAAAI